MMRLLIIILTAMTATSNAVGSAEKTKQKEWTFLVFLNGFNNLDRFGLEDINEMEMVGSTDKVNVVVQWASMSSRKVKRLYIQKDNDKYKITSPVIEDLGSADMGSYKELENFVKWGAEKYPAKHYFVDIWNHGNGWQVDAEGNVAQGVEPGVRNISYDDIHGTEITTEQLGVAMQTFAKAIEHKVDIVGMDACLMAMVEVAGELASSTQFLAASEDLEPGPGWPYDVLLTEWNKGGRKSPSFVGKILTKAYVKSYWNDDDISFASYDLSKYDKFASKTKVLFSRLQQCNASDWEKAFKEIKTYPTYTHSSYVDMEYAFRGLEKTMCSEFGMGIGAAWRKVRTSMNRMVDYKESTPGHKYSPATMSFWFPKSSYEYKRFKTRYQAMQFDRDTGWTKIVENMIPFMSNWQ
ncbi:MAG: hypothetical protein KA715_13630 [Xanthomonadaceae bacterium]|nr:hypothetical protein [Xanthomonadaceae bacterium]